MERPAKRAKLVADDSSSDESEDAAGPTAGFKVNEDYARRFEHNKKREERQRLEEKYNNSSRRADDEEEEDSEEDESEDDEGDLATLDVDGEILNTLEAIKRKDPRVYDKSVTFYREFDAEKEGASKKPGEEKPLYLQDYHRQNLLAGYTGAENDEAEQAPQTYDEEQDAVRQELVDSMHTTANGVNGDNEDDSDNDLLITKSRSGAGAVKQNGVHPARAERIKERAKNITDDDVALADKDPETYLSNFMAARAWVPSSSSRWQAFDSDDSDEEKRADEFEEAYNLRFEDPKTANEKLQSFARDVGKYGVRREEVSGRKKARERGREVKELAKKEREEERARLRKLKIEEAEEKIRKIKDAAGMKGGEEIDVNEWKDVLDGDFDDETWENEMMRRFGEKYYAEADAGAEEQAEVANAVEGKKKVKKPKWNDDIDIGDLVPDFEEEEAKVNFTLSSDEEDGEDNGVAEAVRRPESDEAERIERPAKPGKAKKDRKKEKAEAKRTARRERQQIESIVDSSLPLSHPALGTSSAAEPAIGFRYRDTSPTSFGLSAKDILFADDSQLNQYAGLKKMAAFRDAEKKRRDRKKYSKKGRLREWRKEVFGSIDGPVQRSIVAGGGRNEDVDGGVKGDQDASGNIVEGQRTKKRKRKGKGAGA